MKTQGIGLPLLSMAMMAASPAAASPELSYFGRSSFRIKTSSGFVIYVDPYAPGDYSVPADLVLVSHGHGDHNQAAMVLRKPGAEIVAPKGAVEKLATIQIQEGDAKKFGPVTVRALPAANSNHPRGFGVGYLLSFDGIVLYYSGDTSSLPEMAGWKPYGIDYALLCTDGFWNMGAAEATRCAEAMGAKRLVPIHTSKEGLFDEAVARSVGFAGALVLKPGSVTQLEK